MSLHALVRKKKILSDLRYVLSKTCRTSGVSDWRVIPICAIWCIPFANVLLKIHYSFSIKYWLLLCLFLPPFPFFFDDKILVIIISIQWRIQKDKFMGSGILQYPDKAKRAERLTAWGPVARLRAHVGSSAPGSSWVLAYLKCPERLSCNVIFL